MKRLTCRNNWMMDEYSVGGDRIATLDSVCVNDITYKVTARIVSIPYNDMGHTYNGTSTHYFVKEWVFGVPKEFDLNALVDKVEVYPVDFTLEKK